MHLLGRGDVDVACGWRSLLSCGFWCCFLCSCRYSLSFSHCTTSSFSHLIVLPDLVLSNTPMQRDGHIMPVPSSSFYGAALRYGTGIDCVHVTSSLLLFYWARTSPGRLTGCGDTRCETVRPLCDQLGPTAQGCMCFARCLTGFLTYACTNSLTVLPGCH